MANTDWAQPTTATNYIQVLEDLKDLASLGATLMRVDNPPSGQDPDAGAIEGSIKWSVSNNMFQKNTSTTSTVSWAELTSLYNINVAKLNGKTLSEVTDINNLGGGVLPAVKFSDISHGIRGNGSLHGIVDATSNGFMSFADKVKLDNLKNISDSEVVTAYHNEIHVMGSNDVITDVADIKTLTGAALGAGIDAKLGNGITSVVFNQLYDNGTIVPTGGIDVKSGQYQKLQLTANTTLTIKQYGGQPFTMYLYVDTQNLYTLTLPPGYWSGGSIPVTSIKSAGTELITINSDGSSLYYMLLADMRVV